MRAIGGMKILALAVMVMMLSFPAAVANTEALAQEEPHMQQALDALRQARHHLEAAIPDKAGHRTAAIKAVDEAIKQAQEGIEYEKQH